MNLLVFLASHREREREKRKEKRREREIGLL
jgi:hypothetical protein